MTSNGEIIVPERIKIPEFKSAFREGVKGARGGKGKSSCPYNPSNQGKVFYDYWMEGFDNEKRKTTDNSNVDKTKA